MLCIGVNKIKIHFDTSQLCCGVVHFQIDEKPPKWDFLESTMGSPQLK